MMKDSERSSSRALKIKEDGSGDNKSESWMEGKESRRRESRWDEPESGKRSWDGDVNRATNDRRDTSRREDHRRRIKNVSEYTREDTEHWDRPRERRRDYREDEDRVGRRRSSRDGDDTGLEAIENRGRLSSRIRGDNSDDDLLEKSRSKEGPDFWEEQDDRKRSGGGWKPTKPGRVLKRSRSPDVKQRGRVDIDEYGRDWSDDKKEERIYKRDYDRDKYNYRDRDQEYFRDRDFRDREFYREDNDFLRERARDREDTDRWRSRQRNRQKEEDNIEYNYERDSWEVPRKDRERPQRAREERKDKEQVDVARSPQSSSILCDTVERAGGNNTTSRDFGSGRAFTAVSPFAPRHEDTGPVIDLSGDNEADWIDERDKFGDGSDYRDRYHNDDEVPPGLDQGIGSSSIRDSSGAFSTYGGRGRLLKGSPGHRGRGNAISSDGRPPFASNQGSRIMRGMHQGFKGGRGRGITKGIRGVGGDNQRGGMPVPFVASGSGPGMAPHFGGPMGPPGPIPVIGPNMGPGPAPGIGPGGFGLLPFGGPMNWTAGRGTGEIGMLPGPPVHAGASAPPRFAPSMVPGPGPSPGPTGPSVFFSASGPGRGTPKMMPCPSYGGASFGGRGMMPEKTSTSRMLPRISAPAGSAPSRGEQNDYSQHFVDTGLRPQNFIRDVDLGDRFEEYPKLKELITRKDKLITDRACPPMYMKLDLRTMELSSDLFGTKFDVILVDPPWEEYVRRAPGVGDSMDWWSFEEIQNLRIEAVADTPSFIFLWVGDAEGLDQGRLCLKKWGFRRCEDICWVKANRENPTPALRHDASTLFQHSKEHCLMGIKGTVRRSSDGHIIHANIDTDIIISEEPPYGSTEKPEELYHIIEHFAQGQRRLELFGEDHNIRAGWITVGKNLTSSNFNSQTYCKYVGDADGKVWQGGRGNPPQDAPHLVGTTPEIESLRPKSPPPRAQQQQQSQPANSASQPLAGNSNSKKVTTIQGPPPQNVAANQSSPSQSVAVSNQGASVQGGILKPEESPGTHHPCTLSPGQGNVTCIEEEKIDSMDAQELFPEEERSAGRSLAS